MLSIVNIILNIFFILASNPKCNPKTWTSNNVADCCTKKEPCWLGEGDCDDDDHCVDDLLCGTDNCDVRLGFLKEADCCTDQKGNFTFC